MNSYIIFNMDILFWDLLWLLVLFRREKYFDVINIYFLYYNTCYGHNNIRTVILLLRILDQLLALLLIVYIIFFEVCRSKFDSKWYLKC